MLSLVRGTWGYLKGCNHLFEAKHIFPDIRMIEFGSPDLKKLRQYCAGKVPGLLHPSLYRAVKVTYHMDIGGIVLDRQMTSELGIGNLGQSIGVLSAAK